MTTMRTMKNEEFVSQGPGAVVFDANRMAIVKVGGMQELQQFVLEQKPTADQMPLQVVALPSDPHEMNVVLSHVAYACE